MNTRLSPQAVAGIAGLVLLLASCEKKAAQPPARPPASVTVSQPVQQEVMEWDEYPGHLEAVDMVEVRARVNGYLDSVHFKDGSEVKAGDLLFVIDPKPYQAEVDKESAEVKQAKTHMQLMSNDVQRAEKLVSSKAMSEEEADSRSKMMEQSESALKSASASLEMAKINLGYTRITAPISGRIGRKMITEGNLVNSSQGMSTLLTTIVSMDPIYCYFDADEHSVLKYQKMARDGKGDNMRDGKMKCELELANETGYPHEGKLDFVDNMVNPSTGTLRIRGVFPNPGPDRVLHPGFFARIRVPGSGKYPALLIPDAAIGTDQGQKFVYVVNDKNTVEYHSVQLGPEIGGLRVIHQGLKSNDWVVVNGLMSVRPGSPVNPTHASDTNAAPAAAEAPAKK